jgi:hypothetical protein
LPFNSLPFLLGLLPLTLLLQLLLPRWRNLTLLAASGVFYVWAEPGLGFGLLCAIVAVNFTAGLLIDRTASENGRRRILLAAVVLDLGALAYCK